MPERQKVSNEYLDQTGLSQTGAHCTRRDARLGGGTPLDDKPAVPMPFALQKCFPGLTDESPKTQLRVLKVLNLAHFK